MSHHGEGNGDILSPRSKFYHGPYGRMFRNLPAHVPTIDLIDWSFFKGKLSDGLLDELKEFSRNFQDYQIARLIEKLDELLSDENEALINTELKRVVKEALEDTDKGREAILKLLALTMIEKGDLDQDNDNGNNDCIPAGYTYFSQYITHDITFDPTSSLMRFNDPDKIRNFRTPRLDLDSLYGGGPLVSPFLYDRNKEFGKLLIGMNLNVSVKARNGVRIKKRFDQLNNNQLIDTLLTEENDLPRNSQGSALIGDPRNDENVILKQLHLAFIKFHNKVLDDVLIRGVKGIQAFHEAQRLVRWHYQWIILDDLLPRLVSQEVLDEIWNLRKDQNTILPDEVGRQSDKAETRNSSECRNIPKLCFYQWRQQPFIPVEFAMAAFRFGHSMIRNNYKLNSQLERQSLTRLIHAGYLRENWTVQWDKFLNIKNSPEKPQASRKLNKNLSSSLGAISSSSNRDGIDNVVMRDLLRGYRLDLPSGQAVAHALGIPQKKILKGPELPLWYYILSEAGKFGIAENCEGKGGGYKLGPVGSRIVAEVIVGLVFGDSHSFLNVNPNWTPPYDSLGDKFELQDILNYAGVPLTDKEFAAP